MDISRSDFKSCLKKFWRAKFAIFIIIVVSVIPTCTAYYYEVEDFHKEISTLCPLFFSFLDRNPALILILIAVLSVFLQATNSTQIINLIKPHLPINGEALLAFLNQLERPVESKLDRFSSAILNNVGDDSIQQNKSAKDIFLTITRPNKQISEIVQAIFLYFASIDTNDRKIKVVLFYVNEDYSISEAPHYYPKDSPPSTPLLYLSTDKSPICTAAKKKRVIILEDTNSPPNNIEFIRLEGDDRRGSLLCYPVVVNHFKRAIMVISIFAPNSPGYFERANKKAYEFVLERFAKRLALEHSLLVLKKKVGIKGGKNHDQGQ